jgi:alpha-2-macroglobulin
VKAKGYKDSVLKNIKVIETRLSERTEKNYELKPGLRIEGNLTGANKLTFIDKTRAGYYNKLSWLSWGCGERIDQKIGRVISRELLTKYFDEKPEFDEDFNPLNYQVSQNGGIALLPYSSAELELTSKMASIAKERFNESALISYFYSFLSKKDTDTTKEEVAQAIYGLAIMKEPVLNLVHDFNVLPDLKPKDRLYLALAAEELGDKEYAREIYRGVVLEHGESLPPQLRINIGKDQDDNIAITALTAVLAGKLGEEDAEGYWKYIENNHTNDILIKTEEISYLQDILPNLSSVVAKYSFSVNGKKQDVVLEKGRSKKLTLNGEQLKNFEVVSSQGDIELVNSFFAAPLMQDNSKYVSIKRQYAKKGTNEASFYFKEGDIVDVILSVDIKNDSLDGVYQVTDILPSGLKFTPYHYSSDKSGGCYFYPTSQVGQVMKFVVSKNNNLHCGNMFLYRARVSNTGRYTAEPALIQSLKSSGIKAYSSTDTIVIER